MKKELIAVLMVLAMVSGALALNTPIPSGTVYTDQATYALSVNLDGVQTMAASKVGTLVEEGMNCAAGVCTINAILPGGEGPNLVQFIGFPPFFPPFTTLTAGTIVVDLFPPSVPVVIATAGPGDGEITLAWADSTDAYSGVDHYDVYEGAVIVASPITSDAVITTSTGLHTYTITATDALGHESAASAPTSATAVNTPPATPTVDTTLCQPGSPNCQVVINYAELVNLSITSGGYIQNFVNAVSPITWFPPINPNTNASYAFNFAGTDMGGAIGSYNYSLIVGTGSSVPVNIGGNMESIIINGAYGVKDTAINNGLDWVVIGFDLSLTGDTAVAISLDDFKNGALVTVIDLPTYTAGPNAVASAFCKDDYDSVTQDYDGTGAGVTTPIPVENAYTASTIDCSAAGGAVYVKIGVPANALTGGASTTVNFMN